MEKPWKSHEKPKEKPNGNPWGNLGKRSTQLRMLDFRWILVTIVGFDTIFLMDYRGS